MDDIKETKHMTRRQKEFLLLQINDALFPIGGYSHSYGLETYIQKGEVHDAETASRYIRNMLLYSICQNELMAAAFAYDAAAGICMQTEEVGNTAFDGINKKPGTAYTAGQETAYEETYQKPEKCRAYICGVCDGHPENDGNPEKTINAAAEALAQLDELMTATRAAKEVRQASEKLGSRFIKTVAAWDIPFENEIYTAYTALPGAKNHAVAYGAFCGSAGIGREDMLTHFLYAQTSAMVTNCVKTIPLSQTVGQKLLYRAQDIYTEVLARLASLAPEEFGAEAPGFEIHCMQHEALYSRLYMS